MYLKSLKKSKRAAFEMSITTIVVLVIGLTMLIFGIILVRQIFGTATESIDSIDEQTQNEIMNLFGEEDKDVIVKLGAQQTAKIKQGTKGFGFMVGISPDIVTDLTTCRYSITPGGGNCGNEITFPYGTTNIAFNKISTGSAFALIKIDVPDSQPTCDQLYNIKITCGSWVRQDYFSINIIKKGFL